MSDPSDGSDELETDRVRRVLEQRFGLEPELAAARIGRFVVLDRLGTGAMGVVYRCYDEQLDRSVAVKLLHPEVDSPTLRARLLLEARAMAKVSSPNVATVYESGEHRGRAWVAMELIKGDTLRKWQQRAAQTLPDIVRTYAAAARGLAAAHDAGLVHRDFKPDNAMLDDSGAVKVLDFGLARGSVERLGDEATQDGEEQRSPAELDATPLTREGTLIGTPVYMAPEALAGQEATAASDQFSFCVALFEAVHGIRPFAGKSVHELAAAIARRELAAPARDVPSWLRRIVTRGVALDPKERWPSMHAVADALERGRGRARRLAAIAIAAPALALLVGAIAWQAGAPGRRVAACVDARGDLGEVWGDEVRRRLHDDFVATEAPYAAETAALVEGHVERYAEEWRSARIDACELERSTDDVSQRLSGAATICLDDRRDAIGAFVDALAEPDAAIIRNAVGSATSLPALAACADEGALLAEDNRRGSAPTDAERSIRRLLGAANALESVGRYELAQERADAALVEARVHADEGLVAETLAQIGTIQTRRDQTTQAEATLREAFHTALRVGDDVLAAEAAIELAWTIGYVLARREEGLRWGELARSLVEREGDAAGLRTAALLDTVGAIRDVMGDHAAALEDFQRGLDLRIAALGPDHMLVASSRSNIGLALAALGRTDEALVQLRRGVEIYALQTGADSPWTASSMDPIATILARARRFDEARQEYRKVIAIYEKTLGAEHRLLGDVLGNLGSLEEDAGNFEDALALHRRVEGIYRSLPADHPQRGLLWLNLSSVEVKLGKWDDAAAHARASWELRVPALGAEHPRTNAARLNLAEAELGRGRADAAFEHFTAVAAIEALPPMYRDTARLGAVRSRWQRGERAIALQEAQAMRDAKTLDPSVADELTAWLAEVE